MADAPRGSRRILDRATLVLVVATLALVLFVDGPAYQFTAGAAGVALFAQACAGRKLRRTPLDWWVAAYLAASALAAVVNWDATARRGLALTVVALTFYASAASTLRSAWRIRLLLALFVIGVAHIGLLSTHYHALVGFDQRPGMYPVAPQWSGYPEIGLLAAMAVGVMSGLLVTRRSWCFLAAVAVVTLALVIHLIVTYARGAWVAAAVAVCAVAVWEIVHMRRWRMLGAIAIMAVVVAGTVSFVWNPFLSDFLQQSQTARASSYLARLDIWRESWSLVRDHWVVGVGPGRFGAEMNAVYAEKTRGVSLHAHNTELHVWGERGLGGVIALVGLWLHAMWLVARRGRARGETSSAADSARVAVTARNAWDLRPAVFGALVALFARAQFEHPFDGIPTSPRFTLLFWLFVAAAVAASGGCSSVTPWEAQARIGAPPSPPAM